MMGGWLPEWIRENCVGETEGARAPVNPGGKVIRGNVVGED